MGHRRHLLPSKTECRSTKKLGRVFVDRSSPKDVASFGREVVVAGIRDDYSQYVCVSYLVHKTDVAWASGLFSADMHLDGATEIICTDCGNDSKGRFADLCDRYRIKGDSVIRDTPRPSGYAERGLALLDVTQLAAGVRAGSLFGDVKVPKTTDCPWFETMNWACDPLNQTKASTKPDNTGPHDMWYGEPAKLQASLFSQPGYHRRKRT